jgi:NAD(P)-dependent dehydrogenase (short-subunit alcohol dehydrogenase family)
VNDPRGRLAGKRALLVGAATGIGRAMAREFAACGAQVVVADMNVEEGRESAALAASAGASASFVPVDVRDESAVSRMVTEATGELGGLDVLVNLAAVLRIQQVVEMSVDDWDLTFDVNVRGQFLVAKHAIPALAESGRGSMINVSSAAGFKAGAGNAAYSASKGAIIAFSRTLAMELAPRGIRVNALCPGFVDTPFNDPAYAFIGGREEAAKFVARSIPLQRMARPEEIAPYAVFLASDESAFVTGQAVLIDGGMT